MEGSFRLKIFSIVCKLIRLNHVWQLEGEKLKNEILKKQKKINPPVIKKKLKIEEMKVGNYKTYIISPKNGNNGKLILYIHGGGYVLPITSLHWNFISWICMQTNSKIIVPFYPLVPENCVDDVMNQLLLVYKKLIENKSYSKLSFIGDSAGGDITLTFTLYLKKLGLREPDCVIAISPATSVDFDEVESEKAIKNDYILGFPALKQIGEWYSSKYGVKHWMVSSLNGDLNNLNTKVTIFSSTYDITNINANKFWIKNKDLICYHEYDKLPHIYPLLSFLPESKDARRIIKEILN